MSYFKTNDELVTHARAIYIQQCRRVQGEANHFAQGFDAARAVCAGDLDGRRFVGFTFTRPVDSELWQETERVGVYEPRTEVPDSVTPDRYEAVRQRLGALRLKWALERPYFQADLGPLKTLIGLGGVVQSSGTRFHYVDGVDGYFYFHALAQVGTNCTEISGDEYAAAELSAVKRQGRLTDARERARIL